DAIAYAHSQRVIHRDLKPGNILIGDFGETVVIDWGLAKDLDADDSVESGARFQRPAVKRNSTPSNIPGSSTLTVAGAVMGTPAYMAPEQARGEAVDQRADVFALGAMLYHLLAGVPPYNARTATDVIAAAALGRVVPLTEREHRAPADLVAIVNRAMAQEPGDRYPHAGELADELRRFLTGQLVGAHRYTAMQRVARFVRKHRAAVTIGAIAIVGFAVGGTMAVTRIVRARDDADRERSMAVTRRKAAEHLVDFMISDVKDRLTQIGRLDLLASLGSEVHTYYDTIAKIPGGMPASDLDRMATAVDLVALAERESGNNDGALSSWTQMRDKLAASVAGDTGPATRARRTMVAHFDFETGTIHQQRGKLAEATAAYRQAKQEFDALRVEAPSDHAILLGAADTHDRLGDLLRNDGKVDQAFEEYSEAKAHREEAAGQSGQRPSEEILALSTSHMKLGSVYQVRGESATSLAEYRSAQRLRQTLYDSQPDNVRFQERLLEVDDSLGELQRQVGDDKGSIATIKSALPITESLIRRDETNTSWKRLRGNLLANLGFATLDSGDFKGGVAMLDDAIEVQKQLAARDPKASVWQVDLSRSYTRAGDGRIYLGDVAGGVQQYQAALDIRVALADRDPKSGGYRRSLAWSYHKLGNAFALQNDLPHAIDMHEKALAIRDKLVAESPSQGGFKNELAGSEVVLGKLVAAKDPARSHELLTAAIGRLRALVASDAINNDFKDTLAQGLLAQADAAKVANDAKTRMAALTEAVSIADEAMARARDNVQWPCYLAEANVGLAELAIASGDAKGAATAWKKVRDLLDPLVAAGRLPAPRRPLLDRARAQR
ncbi:MAG TPA: serine/threonine-protein kinase, partial [Kofleriaceae bacterium]|nr:serine/threonine-protein kinase [Kofleriaceae bacterium]